MIFSPADILPPAILAFGDIVEPIRGIDPGRDGLSPAQVAAILPRIDDSVARTHAALEFILRYDERWRTSVFRGETEYNEAIERRIESYLVALADAAQSLVSGLDRYRAYGVYAASMETLRPLIADVRKMLTPDDQFFEGEGLDGLTARAIEEDDRGETVEFRAMGE
jgi:hypothetical protein